MVRQPAHVSAALIALVMNYCYVLCITVLPHYRSAYEELLYWVQQIAAIGHQSDEITCLARNMEVELMLSSVTPRATSEGIISGLAAASPQTPT